MKMHLCLLAGLCTGMLSVHAQQPVQANAILESVTVYNAGAEMNHKAKMDLPAGSSTVIIRNIARKADEKSIRAGSNAHVTILSVSFSHDYLQKQKNSPALLLLKDSLKITTGLGNKITNERIAEKKVLELLDKNSAIGGSQTGVSVTELMKMADYYKEKQVTIQNHIDALTDKEETLDAIEDKLEAQIEELENDRSATTGCLVLQVMADKAAAYDFNVSYLTPDAGWSAFYDLRAASTTDPLNIFYKANVVQHTGIDWKQVKLKLATGNPAQGNIAPELSAWLLRFERSTIYGQKVDKKVYTGSLENVLVGSAPGVAVTSGGGQPGASPDIQIRGQNTLDATAAPLLVVDGAPYNGSLASLDPATVASMTVLKDAAATAVYGYRGTKGVILVTTKNKTLGNYTTAAESDLHTTFDVDIPYDIASNDQPHSVSLKEYSVPVQYKYYAVPRADQDAFLMAEITGYEQLGLMPGEANILFENMYVGKSVINPAITTDTLMLSMGRDKKINIKREKVAELSGVRFLGGSRKQTFTYEIQVRNAKQQTIQLTLKDQYPVTTDKDIEVELLESAAAAVDKETGILTWNLSLQPGETRKIRISYSVSYPKDKSLENL